LGVKVHVLLDWVGSAKVDDRLLAVMEQAGAQVRRFHPPHWSTLGRLNNRTRRKLLIVDGRIGFTGGVGVAPHWMGRAQDPAHWRDTHFQVAGPVVAQMQSVFIENWIKVTGGVLRAGQADSAGAGGCTQARRQAAHRGARLAHRQRRRAQHIAGHLGAAAQGRSHHGRVRAHDVPLQGLDR
jgi:phosphatidylserine/phosphatidylglycerophosphate/cardiolipin synthase-like enzyme